MLISNLGKILDMIQIYHDKDISLSQLADALNISLNNLEALLSWNNFIDGNNRPQPWIDTQDIVNLITLYYAMKPTHEFKLTVFGNPDDGYAAADQTRITIQPLKNPHPSR